ncbi:MULTISPECIES: UbiX family flavin prenyltransferase [Haloferax]|uniref:Flavin prenyltransferase UbiX n=1 Tax=Haloferax marinum TaxID=2666143 RepID=A0A6A8G4N8_9EURY|nr:MULTISPECIES: UbiX family flavin prenyltransferase [Haloferax]KAB1197141.1 UbiX family flavin prenyltransferase [Haloferax sp. CBA1150]MRW96174.1 UbiX family flavin prenyltransferase [Haloferax marinum]
MTDRVIVGVTGATGQIYAVSALRLLDETDYEVHLILSNAAKVNLRQERDHSVGDVTELGDVVHDVDNIGASPASGSFRNDGMIITPCSMKTLAEIAHGHSRNLITRSADVALKERRPLVLMPRETPFNRIHIENMLSVTDAGAIVVPPFPAFYQNPDSIEAMVANTMARALSHLGVDVDYEEWQGLGR